MTFGQRLRAARKAKRLTQKELAAEIKAAHNSISNWENDQNMPDPDTIQNLCWALDVQPNYFFSYDDGIFTLPPTPAPEEPQHINIIKIAGRDGSFRERRLTDAQFAALNSLLDQLPDASDDL